MVVFSLSLGLGRDSGGSIPRRGLEKGADVGYFLRKPP
jgi:hypothetical protein